MTVRALSKLLKDKAEKEINEDSRRVASDIIALREWLKKQPHLESVNPTDQWLIAFLRGCKFSLERSKEKLDMYYTLRAIVPEFFSNRDPLAPTIQEVLKLGLFLPLKSCKSEDSYRSCLVRVGLLNNSQSNLTELLKVSFMITEILMLEDDNFTVAGEEVIVDMKSAAVNVISQWTPTLAKKLTSCFEKALPVRVKSTHFLNTSTGFDAGYAVLRAFLSEKLKKRIQVHHKDTNDIHKAIPKSVLPAEYGGEDGSLQELIDYWKNKVESYRDWFLAEAKIYSNETKRPGKPKTSTSLFGVDGSFRKLEFD